MAKQFKSERAVQQQEGICRGLVDLMQEHTYGDITAGKICRQAGIPRRTFYYYFDGKEDVLYFLIRGLMMESDLESTLSAASGPEMLEESLTRFFLYWKERRSRELRALIRSGMEQKLISHCMGWISEETQWVHLMERYTEEEWTVSLMLGISCVLYTLFHWCSRDFQQSPEYMASCVTRVLTKPLYAGI